MLELVRGTIEICSTYATTVLQALDEAAGFNTDYVASNMLLASGAARDLAKLEFRKMPSHASVSESPTSPLDEALVILINHAACPRQECLSRRKRERCAANYSLLRYPGLP